jgi:hypothetical protein
LGANWKALTMIPAVQAWLFRQPNGRTIEDRCGWQVLRTVAVECKLLPEVAGDADESEVLEAVNAAIDSPRVLFVYLAECDRWQLSVARR